MRHHGHVQLWSLVLLFHLMLCACSSAENLKDTEFLEDKGGLLTQQERQQLVNFSKTLLKDLDIHIKTVILSEQAQDMNRKANTLFEEFALGEQTRGAKGVLFLVDPKGKQVRLEIGYDLEAVYPDAFVSYIVHKQMVPFFQSNRVGSGIAATMELLVGKALGEIKDSEYLPEEDTAEYSGGAGVKTEIEIGSGAPDKPETVLADRFAAQPSPLQTLDMYRHTLRLHIKDPNLGIYTPETREFFSKWLVTDAQQENGFKSLDAVFELSEVHTVGDVAVIRYPISNRQANPYFLRHGEEGWMLDFASMNTLIGFNHKNQWFFRNTEHEFMFAFEDVRFDKHGFPHRQE